VLKRNAINGLITSTAISARELQIEALASMSASFERLYLAARTNKPKPPLPEIRRSLASKHLSRGFGQMDTKERDLRVIERRTAAYVMGNEGAKDQFDAEED
jgi:hypothetical protein